MKRIMALILAALMLLTLAACGGEVNETTTGPAPTTAEPLPPETDPPTDPPTEPSTEPSAEPSEPVFTATNPLSGVQSAEPLYNRPFAVMINNIRYAQPLCSVSEADMMIEALTEGGITRFLALYTDLEQVEHIGSIRSSRPCYISLARAFDAIYVHAGGSRQAYDLLSSTGIDHLDGIRAASSAFYRDQARLSAGYSTEHTLFTEGSNLVAQAEKQGCTMTRQEPIDFGYQFTALDALEEGDSAQKIRVSFGKNGKTTDLTYDADAGNYHAAQYGDEMVDGNTGEAVTFANVLVLEVKTTSEGQYVMMTLTGSGKGWFASGGRMVPITWSRSGESEPFVFTLEDGSGITLATGHTYMALVPTGSPVTFQ